MHKVSWGGVSIYHTDVASCRDQLEPVYDVLSSAEHQRAERFRFERDRRCYVVGRGMLRLILGEHLSCDPACLRFAYGRYGKPGLAEPGETNVHFNISHAHTLVAIAVAEGRRVGIDVEQVRALDDMDRLARRFFSIREYAALRALPPEERREAFFRCWTRKEAYVKARGDGLTLPLDRFDVSLRPGAPAALLGTRPDPAEATRWGLHDLGLMDGYQSALAVEVV